MFSYMATSFLGFEAVCESEIKQKLKPHSTRILPQKVIFSSDILPSKIDHHNLKSAVRVCAYVAEFNDLPLGDGTGALARMEQYAAECDWSKPMQSFYLKFPGIQPSDHQFRVTAERRGLEHKGWKSPEAAGAIGAGIVEQFKWKVNLKNYNTEIFIEIDDRLVTIGVVLCSDMNKRNRVNHAWKTALNCSFSYCLARVANIQPGETVCDPLCGVGTILNEAALEWPNAVYIGGDIDAPSIEQAKIHAAYCKSPASHLVWDSTSLPLKTASLDIILSDLPFGHRHGSSRQNQQLYPKLFREWHRVLKLGGRCLIVTTAKNIVKNVLQSYSNQWRLDESYMVDVGGFMAQLYHLTHVAPYVDLSGVSLDSILSSPQSAHLSRSASITAASTFATATASGRSSSLSARSPSLHASFASSSDAPSPHTIFSSMSPALAGHHGMTMGSGRSSSLDAITLSSSTIHGQSHASQLDTSGHTVLHAAASNAPSAPSRFKLPIAAMAPIISSSPALRAAFAALPMSTFLSSTSAPSGTISTSSSSSSSSSGLPPIALTPTLTSHIFSHPSHPAPPAPLALSGSHSFSQTPALPTFQPPAQRTPILIGVSPKIHGISPAQRPALVLSSPSLIANVGLTGSSTTGPATTQSPSLTFAPTFSSTLKRSGSSTPSSSAQASPALPPRPPAALVQQPAAVPQSAGAASSASAKDLPEPETSAVSETRVKRPKRDAGI